MDGTRDTLYVRHLPDDLEEDERIEFFKHFGAERVRSVRERTRHNKHTAYVTFPDPETAKDALTRLHQLDLLGHTLVVEYAKNVRDKPTLDDCVNTNPALKTTSVTNTLPVDENAEIKYPRFQNIAEKWGFSYPINPSLRYSYPPPDVNIITNIAHALVALPKFYYQVLHLMNKMNLPAPFGPATAAPPLPLGTPYNFEGAGPTQLEHVVREEVAPSSDESLVESEIESEGEGAEVETLQKNKRRKTDENQPRKKHKLQHIVSAPKSQTNLNPDEIFETPEGAAAKKIEIKLPVEHETPQAANEVGHRSVDATTVAVEPGGFGKIEPTQKVTVEDVKVEAFLNTEFIPAHELEKGRLSKKQMKEFSVFKRYSPGEVNTRLYIKNLAKQTTEDDVRYVFGRYVKWGSELEENMFDIRLMTEGRMKGQCFVTLATERVAEKACQETNGYVMNGKPMVVQFARSAKPKDAVSDKILCSF